jgi:hypothetical protein
MPALSRVRPLSLLLRCSAHRCAADSPGAPSCHRQLQGKERIAPGDAERKGDWRIERGCMRRRSSVHARACRLVWQVSAESMPLGRGGQPGEMAGATVLPPVAWSSPPSALPHLTPSSRSPARSWRSSAWKRTWEALLQVAVIACRLSSLSAASFCRCSSGDERRCRSQTR